MLCDFLEFFGTLRKPTIEGTAEIPAIWLIARHLLEDQVVETGANNNAKLPKQKMSDDVFHMKIEKSLDSLQNE